MELSKRLQAVADLVTEGTVVADVGTDHGYIPIYLIKMQKAPRAFAMDVNEGPLKRATEHIYANGMSDRIETRLSNGVKELLPGEAECVVIAGMGGALIIRILEEGQAVFRQLKEFVLQPQSELAKVRKYLNDHKYSVIAEDMVLEDGKFYPMMKVTNGCESAYTELELRYGRKLLQEKHPVLNKFLKKELIGKEKILENLMKESGSHIEIRRNELENELDHTKKALEAFV